MYGHCMLKSYNYQTITTPKNKLNVYLQDPIYRTLGKFAKMEITKFLKRPVDKHWIVFMRP
jgi:hypothetical protein